MKSDAKTDYDPVTIQELDSWDGPGSVRIQQQSDDAEINGGADRLRGDNENAGPGVKNLYY